MGEPEGIRPRWRAVPGGDRAPDRRHLPARASDEMFPARGRVAVFEAPRDASSLDGRWLDSGQRRREPGLEAVCIDTSDTSRDTSGEEGVDASIINTKATPPERAPRTLSRACKAASPAPASRRLAT